MCKEGVGVEQMEEATTIWREAKRLKINKMGPKCEPFVN
jgi:hypothetical protein